MNESAAFHALFCLRSTPEHPTLALELVDSGSEHARSGSECACSEPERARSKAEFAHPKTKFGILRPGIVGLAVEIPLFGREIEIGMDRRQPIALINPRCQSGNIPKGCKLFVQLFGWLRHRLMSLSVLWGNSITGNLGLIRACPGARTSEYPDGRCRLRSIPRSVSRTVPHARRVGVDSQRASGLL